MRPCTRGDEARLRDSMQELLLLYRELVTLCTAERKRLGDELVQINQARQGPRSISCSADCHG